MEETTISDWKETELNHIAMTEAIVNLQGRLKQTGDQFTSTWVKLQTRSKELQTREEDIGRREKILEEKESSLESKEAELEQIEEAITEKLLDFEQGKRELESLNLLINEKKRMVLEVQELIRVKEKECGLFENQFEKIEKSFKEIELKMELKDREFEEVLLKKLELEKELLEPSVDELGVIVNNVKECLSEVERREREVESKVKEVEMAVIRVNEGRNEVQRKEREVESKERRVLERFKKVELKEEHLCFMEKLIEENKRGLDLLMKTSEEKGKQLEERQRNLALVSDEIERKEREIWQQAEALELKRAQFGSQLMIQQLESMPGANNAVVPYSSSDFIRKLIEKKLLMEAVTFICAFKLNDKLPPVPFLEEYVEDVMMSSEVICRSQGTPDEKDAAVNGKIADLRAAIQCIKDYNLESEFPSKTVEIQIAQLEMCKELWRSPVPILVPKVEHEDRKRKKPFPSSAAPALQPDNLKIKLVLKGGSSSRH